LRLRGRPLGLQGSHQSIVLDRGDPLHQALLGGRELRQVSDQAGAVGLSLLARLDVRGRFSRCSVKVFSEKVSTSP
jgi:hypothetical protein